MLRSKNSKIQHYFFNVKISAIIRDPHFTFSVIILDTLREGTVSQIYDMWYSFYFKQCRKFG